MLKFLKSRGFMGGVMSILGVLSMVFGITVDPEVVQALMDNIITVITLCGVILSQVLGIWGRIKAKGPIE